MSASFTALAAAATLAVGGSALPLKQVARVPLSGSSVRFDYTSLDPGSHRLYIAHMDASRLLVFDLRTRRVIKTIQRPACTA